MGAISKDVPHLSAHGLESAFLMNQVYVFLIRNDVWIYFLAAFGLFWYTTELWRARQLLRRAMFGLERETGANRRNHALVFIMLLGGLVGYVYYVNTWVAPNLPATLLRPPTPTPDIFATPLAPPSPLAPLIEASATPAFAATVTLPGESAPIAGETAVPSTPTPLPVTPTPFIACTIDLNIREPINGSAASGQISFTGTADTGNFGYYRLEANGPQTSGKWASLLGRDIDTPVIDSFLGNADLSDWAAGPYLIRLTAVDTNNNLTGACVIQITLTP